MAGSQSSRAGDGGVYVSKWWSSVEEFLNVEVAMSLPQATRNTSFLCVRLRNLP